MSQIREFARVKFIDSIYGKETSKKMLAPSCDSKTFAAKKYIKEYLPVFNAILSISFKK
jgi:hypothetical protein